MCSLQVHSQTRLHVTQQIALIGSTKVNGRLAIDASQETVRGLHQAVASKSHRFGGLLVRVRPCWKVWYGNQLHRPTRSKRSLIIYPGLSEFCVCAFPIFIARALSVA